MATKGGKPFQSKLVPFEAFIRGERKRRQSYRQIAETLRVQHGLEVNFRTVQNFVKVRAKRPRGYRLPERVDPAPVQLRPAHASVVTEDNPIAPAPALAPKFNDVSRLAKNHLAIAALKKGLTDESTTQSEEAAEVSLQWESGKPSPLTRLPRQQSKVG